MGSRLNVCIVFFSKKELLRGSVPLKYLVRRASPGRNITRAALVAVLVGGCRRFPFRLLQRSPLARRIDNIGSQISGPYSLTLSNGRANAWDVAFINLVNVRGFLRRYTSRPGLVSDLVALAAQGVPDWNNARPIAGAGISEPRSFAPSSSRRSEVAEMALSRVLVFRDWLANRL